MFKRATLLSLLALSGFAGAQDTILTWTVQGYDDSQATVGDSVTFNYNTNHNVYIHPTGDCSEDGSILVGANDASPVTYTFTAADAGSTVFFACNTGMHCENGQKIGFTVVDTVTIVDDTGMDPGMDMDTPMDPGMDMGMDAPTIAPGSAAAKATLSVATVAAAFAMML
jgi:hypothetical protein